MSQNISEKIWAATLHCYFPWGTFCGSSSSPRLKNEGFTTSCQSVCTQTVTDCSAEIWITCLSSSNRFLDDKPTGQSFMLTQLFLIHAVVIVADDHLSLIPLTNPVILHLYSCSFADALMSTCICLQKEPSTSGCRFPPYM